MEKKIKKRIEIFVGEETKLKLESIAESLSIGVATVVKLAIEKYLKEQK